jgi:basic membrane protein A
MTERAILKAFFSLTAILFLSAYASPALAIPPQAKVRAAFIYPSPIGDFGWAYSHDIGRKELEKRLPYVETAYSELVPEGAEALRVMEAYIRRGYNLIVATSFGYMDSVLNLAQKYPNVAFLHATGFKTAPNMSNYFGRMYEARYLAGIVAGKMTKSGILGYVAGFPIPDVLRGINAILLGARSVNPRARVHVVWTQSWYDPAKEREAADSLLDGGADVIHIALNSPAPLQAAERRGRYAIGFSTDMSAFAPKAHLTAGVWKWVTIYEYAARSLHEGTFKGESIWWGFNKDAIELSPLGPMVPPEVRRLVEEKKKEIIEGRLQVFAGPLRDQKGKEIVPAGQVLSDEAAFGMNFLLEGVVGSLP